MEALHQLVRDERSRDASVASDRHGRVPHRRRRQPAPKQGSGPTPSPLSQLGSPQSSTSTALPASCPHSHTDWSPQPGPGSDRRHDAAGPRPTRCAAPAEEEAMTYCRDRNGPRRGCRVAEKRAVGESRSGQPELRPPSSQAVYADGSIVGARVSASLYNNRAPGEPGPCTQQNVQSAGIVDGPVGDRVGEVADDVPGPEVSGDRTVFDYRRAEPVLK